MFRNYYRIKPEKGEHSLELHRTHNATEVNIRFRVEDEALCRFQSGQPIQIEQWINDREDGIITFETVIHKRHQYGWDYSRPPQMKTADEVRAMERITTRRLMEQMADAIMNGNTKEKKNEIKINRVSAEGNKQSGGLSVDAGDGPRREELPGVSGEGPEGGDGNQ